MPPGIGGGAAGAGAADADPASYRADTEAFVAAAYAAIAADGRSYRDEVMLEAAAIARGLQLRSERRVAAFEKLAADARTRASEDEEEETDLGDIPDEFLDPIYCTLMRDPVKLPSGHSCDRSIITRHLLSDETDPFSRQPLTADQLVPDDDLREKIAAFIADRKSASGR